MIPLALAGIVALWGAGSMISAPARVLPAEPPADLGAIRVEFESRSKASLVGWYSPPPTGRPTVVVSHGVRGSKGQLVDRARFLRGAGYGVLLYDAQAHGESSGDAVTFGYLEAHDAAAAIAFVRRETSGVPVAFVGPSLAGAAALLGPEPLAADALVLEAVYSTLEKAVVNRIGIRLGPSAASILSKLLLFQVEPRLGFDPYALNPIERIHDAAAPILLIAGEKDRHTTLDESHALYAAAPDPKELWVVAGAAHESFHRHSTREYERRVLGFLARYLDPGAAQQGAAAGAQQLRAGVVP